MAFLPNVLLADSYTTSRGGTVETTTNDSGSRSLTATSVNDATVTVTQDDPGIVYFSAEGSKGNTVHGNVSGGGADIYGPNGGKVEVRNGEKTGTPTGTVSVYDGKNGYHTEPNASVSNNGDGTITVDTQRNDPRKVDQ